MSNFNTNSKPIFAGSIYVGCVKNNRFCKAIVGSKHILHTPPALALAVESLTQAERAGATEIEITDKESGYVYFSTVSHFRRYAFDLQRGGYEKQRALVLERWTVTHTDVFEGTNPSYSGAPKVVETNETEPPKYAEVQLSLFKEKIP